ncbi:retrovirus-related pol polyprotein from transposon TNT 1-94 [Tanacetum coccineum]|uniref:Retrovirus-related pol polyprotein from transposon TNT 1-94 n=1 Tax=Tanacetum coccineum TaxID=301880 RepID=A0ABQ4ZV85_9ASTR
MCLTENMVGWKPKDLKNKSFANIQELFNKAFKRVNTFVDFRTELVEGPKIEESSKKAEVMKESSSKRARDEIEQENVKKKKVDDDHESAKMKELMKIVPDEEEVAVDAIPFATKPPSIVDWKIVKEGKISYYQIIRADGNSKRGISNKASYKTPYELFLGRKPALGFMRPFGCPVTILNTIDHLGKFDSKADEGFFVGYSINSKAFKVLNSRTRIVEENLHVQFSENTLNISGSGPNWLFDIDALTKSMKYKLIIVGNQSNSNAGTKECDDAGKARMETVPGKDYIMLPLWKKGGDSSNDQEKEDSVNSTNNVNVAITNEVNFVGAKTSIELLDEFNMLELFSKEQTIKVFKIACLLAFLHKKNPKRLVAQGYTQEEGIDYDEVFAPVARIEAIRLFLAYASFKDFMVYQMDVKSAFLYGKIEEEVYVCQPPGFEDPDFPDRVYKVEKALYGLHQAPRACQDKYGTEILKKFGFTNVKTASTPMETQKPLLKDEDAKEVDVYLYRSMIGSLMYLLIQKDLSFDLVAYTDSDYTGASLDRKSTTGGCQFLGCRLISWQCKKQTVVANSIIEAEYVAASSCCDLLTKAFDIVVTEQPARREFPMDDEEGTNCFPNATIFEELTRMRASPMHGMNLVALLASAIILFRPQTKSLTFPIDKDSMTLKELMDFCTKLQQRVLNLENTKTAQAQEITSLKKRVKKLEKKGGSRPHKLKRLYKVGRSTRIVSSNEASLGDQEDASKQGRKIDDIDKDAEITLVNETQGRHDDDIMFYVSDLAGEEECVAEQGVPDSKKDDAVQVNTAATTVSTASTILVSATTINEDEINLAQALAELKSVKPKVTTATIATTKGILLQELSESITTTTTTIPSKDKGKGIMVEEPLKMKKKYQTSFDEQEAIRLQAEFTKIDVDYQLAQRLQAQEQEELTIEERAKLFQQLLEKRRKHFAAKRAEEKRNIPPTKAQQRSIMYMNTELVKESSKKADAEMAKRCSKEQGWLEQEKEVVIDAIPLATKPLSIVDFKILKEGKISYIQIIRADRSSKRIVEIKRLLDDLRVTTAKLMLLVQKLLLLVLKVNAAGMKVTTAERLQLLEEFMLTEKRSKTY